MDPIHTLNTGNWTIYLCSIIETTQNPKCSIIWTPHVTHLTCSRFGHLKQSTNQICYGSRPFGQIRQIIYLYLSENNFGKPQLQHLKESKLLKSAAITENPSRFLHRGTGVASEFSLLRKCIPVYLVLLCKRNALSHAWKSMVRYK